MTLSHIAALTAAFTAILMYGTTTGSSALVAVGISALTIVGFIVAIKTDDTDQPMLEQLTADQ